MKEHARTLERELAKAVAALEFIRDAGGTTSDDAEYGQINYNGSWCAEQARAALYSIANTSHHAEPRSGGDSVDGVVLPPNSVNQSERKWR